MNHLKALVGLPRAQDSDVGKTKAAAGFSDIDHALPGGDDDDRGWTAGDHGENASTEVLAVCQGRRLRERNRFECPGGKNIGY